MSDHALESVTAYIRDLGDGTLVKQSHIGEVGRKADRSLVTEIDRSNEAALADLLKSIFPADGITGEEGTRRPSTNDIRWLIDPIDGTRQFVRGQLFWGILVARLHGDKPVYGAIYHPPRVA
jgi:fructose-1,6-bisphosphatase/inositol monophosphatase family enzyme